MKINFRLLGKATWEIMKIPLLVLLVVTAVTTCTVALVLVGFVIMAAPILLALTVIGIFVFLITMRYKEMMIAHRKEQQHIVDVLTR